MTTPPHNSKLQMKPNTLPAASHAHAPSPLLPLSGRNREGNKIQKNHGNVLNPTPAPQLSEPRKPGGQPKKERGLPQSPHSLPLLVGPVPVGHGEDCGVADEGRGCGKLEENPSNGSQESEAVVSPTDSSTRTSFHLASLASFGAELAAGSARSLDLSYPYRV